MQSFEKFVARHVIFGINLSLLAILLCARWNVEAIAQIISLSLLFQFIIREWYFVESCKIILRFTVKRSTSLDIFKGKWHFGRRNEFHNGNDDDVVRQLREILYQTLYKLCLKILI